MCFYLDSLSHWISARDTRSVEFGMSLFPASGNRQEKTSPALPSWGPWPWSLLEDALSRNQVPALNSRGGSPWCRPNETQREECCCYLFVIVFVVLFQKLQRKGVVVMLRSWFYANNQFIFCQWLLCSSQGRCGSRGWLLISSSSTSSLCRSALGSG